MPRFRSAQFFKNNDEMYYGMIKSRNLKFINQMGTPELTYPDTSFFDNYEVIRHEWQDSDKLWKLSEKYYGSPQYWWVIAYTNKIPSEFELNSGDIIDIVMPLRAILNKIEGL